MNLTQYINIPRICSIGSQSAGKTSILTNIIGLDILPKGDGVVTRRPIELRLNKIKSGEPYIFFENDLNNKITDFTGIKDKITNLTNSICGNDKNILDKPLIINIYSPTCPDLTILDLPGISKIPIGDQPKNIEEITKNMTIKYIINPYTIILCAISSNQDITISDGLYLSKQFDYSGERTLGVLTKFDLMDKGTNCKEILSNKLIPLKYGYIAVKNRSKLDSINNISVKEGLEKEKIFFKNNETFNKMNKKIFGTQSLINKIVEIYTNMFYLYIDDTVYSINHHLRRIDNELSLLGKPLINDLSERNALVQNLINNYCETFFNILNNKINNNGKNENNFIENENMNKIKILYDNFLSEYCNKNNFCVNLKINFPRETSYLKILTPYLKDIEDESVDLFKSVIDFSFKVSYKIICDKFKQFPLLENIINEIVENAFKKEIQNTKNLLETMLKNEFEFEFTNDKNFKQKYDKKQIIESNDINLFKESVNEYFKIIVRNIRKGVPRIILYKFIYYLEKDLFNILINHFIQNQDVLYNLKESEDHITLRNNLSNTKIILEKFVKQINYSPLATKEFLTLDRDERKKKLQTIQKEKRDKLFSKSIQKLKEIRNKNDNLFRREDMKDIVEGMCIIGSLLEESIKKEKEENPEKFIPIEEAIQKEDKEDSIFCLGLLEKNLEAQGIMTVIKKEETKTEEEKELSICTLDFIYNGMLNKKKYDLHFDFGEKRNEQLLMNEYE